MASIAIPKRRPWDAIPGSSAVSRGVAQARQYPIFPLAILLILLIIPALTADWLAPHDHRVGDLDVVRMPPAWVSETTEFKVVVQRVSDNDSEISDTIQALRDAALELDALLEEFKANPSRAVLGDPPPKIIPSKAP